MAVITADAPSSFRRLIRREIAEDRARRRAAPPPRTPEAALRSLIVKAENGASRTALHEMAPVLIADPHAPMALLFLSYAERARVAGLKMRMVIAQRRRIWGGWREAPVVAALDILGSQHLRLLSGEETELYYNQAAFGVSALWIGPRICQPSLFTPRGQFRALSATPEDRSRAHSARASFDAVWRVARSV